MAGFPTRTSRDGFGPTLENERAVKNEKIEISAERFNSAWWNLAGLSQVGAKALIHATVSGGVVTNAFQSFAFDPNGAVSPITFTYEAAGWFSFALSATYPDETGASIATALESGFVQLSDASEYNSAHDGTNNSATLDDSTQAWTVNGLVGKYVYNLTDGSSAAITANTATQVTATLSGGTDNDWDTGDAYVIVSDVVTGIVELTSSYGGNVYFFDSSRVLADPAGFTLVLY